MNAALATERRVLQQHAQDNVAIAVQAGGLPAGTVLAGGLVLRDAVPQAHKVALQDIPAGAPVRRYGVAIAHALRDIAAGSWVHERLLQPLPARELQGLPMATAVPPAAPPLQGHSFQGYRNPDGSVGTRNLLAISTTVQCVAGVLDVALQRIRSELLPRFPHVDGVVGLEHAYGCGVAINAPGAEIPTRTLRHLAMNPNFGGEVMLLGLGCEKLQPELLLPPGSLPLHTAQTLSTLRLQDPQHVGFGAMVDHLVQSAVPHLERLNARRRETVPASALVVGVQCGGSDAFSGLTANPAVGHCTDLLLRAGATVLFSETTEVRDAIAQLTARAATPAVAQRLVDEMAWYDAYLARGGADRSANTTPGNKAGGLSHIVEKAMGSVVKSGSAAITGVLSPGERVPPGAPGLYYCATPASDFICGTLQLAAGMNLHVFTTGRGTPYGLAACPVLKVATRSELAERWHDLMDIDAGPIADGRATVQEIGELMFRSLLAVASGQRTWAEHWGLHNALVLFNPAPVT